MFKLIRALFAQGPSAPARTSGAAAQAPKRPAQNPAPVVPVMNEGDFHSGPEGYSANTAYPETQYGSGFDKEADWNDDEHQ